MQNQVNALMKKSTLEINPTYLFKIKGRLEPHRLEWFGSDFSMEEKNGNTFLKGRVKDQAALHGMLKMIRDLGLVLISVNRLEDGVKCEKHHRGKS